LDMGVCYVFYLYTHGRAKLSRSAAEFFLLTLPLWCPFARQLVSP
jgi:hypothetical protein